MTTNNEKLNRINGILNTDYTDRHDNPMMYITESDIKFLLKQVESYKKLAATNNTYHIYGNRINIDI